MKNIAGYIFACAQDRPDVRLPAPIDAILRSCMPQFTAQTCPNITKNPPFRCRGKRRNDGLSWSDQRDLNPRPLDPQSSALPNCAMVRTVRKAPNMKHSIISTVFQTHRVGKRVASIPESLASGYLRVFRQLLHRKFMLVLCLNAPDFGGMSYYGISASNNNARSKGRDID